MNSWKSNRSTRKPFLAGRIIESHPDIVSFESVGSVYVEDGSGQRYIVKYFDGRLAEVEFSDAFDAESSEVSEEEVGQAEDNEDRDVKQVYTIRVVWDGTVDFEESYNANSEDERLKVSKTLIRRYGKIAEDFLGKTSSELEDGLQERRDEKESDSESFV